MPNEVIRHLWQGSCPRSISEVKKLGVTLLVFCAREIQPPDHVCVGVRLLRCPFDDDGSHALYSGDRDMIRATAREVARHVKAGGSALVTCAAGLNRSGTVSALAVHHLTGLSASECFYLVRAARGRMALGNPQFTKFLVREIDEKAKERRQRHRSPARACSTR